MSAKRKINKISNTMYCIKYTNINLVKEINHEKIKRNIIRKRFWSIYI